MTTDSKLMLFHDNPRVRILPLAFIFLMLHPVTFPEVCAQDELLVALTETGEERSGLPVFEIHPDADSVVADLLQGISGTLLRLYRMEQTYLQSKEDISPQPAYLLLSGHQGGYAKVGFFLGEEDMSDVSYVDLFHGWPVTGSFGAMDQILPHELAHVIRRQLAGPLGEGMTNQLHGLGIRTDRIVAFNEGLAEHFQAMAIDAVDGHPVTMALADDYEIVEKVERQLNAYRREMTALISLATPFRMGFVLWFSNAEDVLRHYAVKQNAFAREPLLPERLLSVSDPYRAYLLENILPGDPEAPVKSLSRMVATEGVISTLFYRWVNTPAISGSYKDEAFYREFGTRSDLVSGLENAYLKLFHVLYHSKPQDIFDLVTDYKELFPEETEHIDSLVADVFLGRWADSPPEFWMANRDFQTGTTIFDHFRGMPRTHTFELNAASIVDLTGVPGVDFELARAIIDHAPFETMEDLRRVPGITDELLDHFRQMSAEMDLLLVELEAEAEEETLSLTSILMPFVRRAIVLILLAACVGAILYRNASCFGQKTDPATTPPSWIRAVINGLFASLVAFISGWLVMVSAGLASLLTVGVLFGIPAGLWCLLKKRGLIRAVQALGAWLVAALPAALCLTPWF